MALRQTPSLKGEDPFRRIIEACFRREVDSATPFPNETEDLIETGILDSMAWVSFLRAVETASGVSDLGSVLNEQPASIASVLAALRESSKKPLASDHSQRGIGRPAGTLSVLITASCSAQGSCVVPSEEVDRAFGMPIGKLRKRAGIESLAYATKRENELTLARKPRRRCFETHRTERRNSTGLLPPAKRITIILHYRRNCTPGCWRERTAALWMLAGAALDCSTRLQWRNR